LVPLGIGTFRSPSKTTYRRVRVICTFLEFYSIAGITSTPSGWDPERFRQWNNESYGGSSTIYNNVWLNLYSRPDDILPTQSKTGFHVHSSDLFAPDSVQFFTFAAAGTYTGHSNYSNNWNPGFEGTAKLTGTSVPEPGAFLGLGIGLVALVRRRQKISL
jgi:hypothetical protein